MTQDLEYSFVRDLSSGTPKDTDNNQDDFLPVETSLSGATTLGEHLGSPGPESSSSPITHNSPDYLQIGLIDSGVSSGVSPNRDRNVNDTDMGTEGSLSINRTITNTSGLPLTTVRLRVVSISTALQAQDRADLRVKGIKIQRGQNQSQSWDLVPLQDPDPPFDPSLGGGLNTTLTVISPFDASMDAGETLTISIVLGVESFGSFKFAANLEAEEVPPP
jgi:hypothetical protein